MKPTVEKGGVRRLTSLQDSDPHPTKLLVLRRGLEQLSGSDSGILRSRTYVIHGGVNGVNELLQRCFRSRQVLWILTG